MALKRKAVTGVIWVGISFFSAQVLGLLASIALARLLEPKDFGLLSLSTVVVSLSKIFSEMGFGGALVQRQTADQEAADTAFTLNSFLSIFLAAVIVSASSLIGGLFNEPQMAPILKVLALNIVLSSVIVVPSNLLERELQFKRKVWAEVTPPIGYAIVAVGCAMMGWGVWSLVVGTVASSLLQTMLMWSISGYRPSWKFDWGIAKELWQFGQHLVYASLLLFVAANLDQVYIGRFINVAEVGFYGLALTLGNISTDSVAKLFGRVLFPAFSRVQSNLPRLKEAYLTSVRYISYLSFPMSFGLFVVASVAVSVVYGSKWAPSVPLIRIQSLYGLFRSMGRLAGPLFSSIGKPSTAVKIIVLRVLILTLFVCLLGSKLASVGVAIALTLSMSISVLWSFYLVNRHLDISIVGFLKELAPQCLAAAVMGVGVGLMSRLLTASLLALVAMVGCGIAIYVLMLWLLAGERLNKDVLEIISLIFGRDAEKVELPKGQATSSFVVGIPLEDEAKNEG